MKENTAKRKGYSSSISNFNNERGEKSFLACIILPCYYVRTYVQKVMNHNFSDERDRKGLSSFSKSHLGWVRRHFSQKRRLEEVVMAKREEKEPSAASSSSSSSSTHFHKSVSTSSFSSSSSAIGHKRCSFPTLPGTLPLLPLIFSSHSDTSIFFLLLLLSSYPLPSIFSLPNQAPFLFLPWWLAAVIRRHFMCGLQPY